MKGYYDINRIGFLKGIGNSIAKPSTYLEMSNQGKLRAISHFWILLTILAIVASSIYINGMKKYYKAGLEQIKENLPEMQYSDGQLTAEENDKEFVTELFNNITIAIKTDVDENAITEEYLENIQNENGALILLNDKIIVVDKENAQTSYTYQEFNDKYLGIEKDKEILNKEDILEYISKISYTAYFFSYFLTCFFIYGFIFSLQILLASIIGIILVKIMKLNLKFRQLIKMSIYAFTLPLILFTIYLIISYIANANLYYFQVFCALIGMTYLVIAIKKTSLQHKS